MTGRGKLSDAELSKKLGHYQKMSRVWILVGLFGALSGTVSYFAVQDTALKAILTGVLFFGGVCCAIFLGGSAQKKLQALIQEQFGDFFRAEWEKAFGPDMHTPEMCIDEPFLRTFHLLDGQWEECTVENFHEGDYRGVHFSAANVRLDHVYERGCGHEGYETCHEMIFKGLVLRCETRTPAPSPVLVNARTEDSPRGAATGDALFDRCFCVTAEPEQDALSLLAPQFMELMNEFRQRVEGQLLGFRWEGRVLSLAVETDYGFAAVASGVDMSDLDAVRRSYVRSLHEMEGLLDVLLDSSELLSPQE